MRNVLAWICCSPSPRSLPLATHAPAATGSRPTPTACPGRASRAGSPTPPARPRWRADSTPATDRPAGQGIEPDGRRLLRLAPAPGHVGRRLPRHQRRPRSARAASLAGTSAMAPASGGLLSVDRRLFGASATAELRHRAGHRRRAARPALHRHRLQQPVAAAAAGASAPTWAWSRRAPATRCASAGSFGGSQNLDDVVRDMRLAPVVQLGVSYSF